MEHAPAARWTFKPAKGGVVVMGAGLPDLGPRPSYVPRSHGSLRVTRLCPSPPPTMPPSPVPSMPVPSVPSVPVPSVPVPSVPSVPVPPLPWAVLEQAVDEELMACIDEFLRGGDDYLDAFDWF